MNDAKIEISDLPWAVFRLGRSMAFKALPATAHVELAVLRGWLCSHICDPPDHVRENIERVFGDSSPDEIRQIERHQLALLKRHYLTRILPVVTDFTDAGKWPVGGLGHLDEALERGRGAILVSAHLGYVRLIRPILVGRGYDITLVAAGSYDSPKRIRKREKVHLQSSRFRTWLRDRTRVRTDIREPEDIPAMLDVRPLLDILSRNGTVMILGDGLRSARFVRMDLLGNSYPFPVGFIKLGMLMDTPVLPTFAVEGGRGARIRIEIHPALRLDPEADLASNLREFVEILDRQLRRTPHLWHQWILKNCFEWALEHASGDFGTRYFGKDGGFKASSEQFEREREE